MVAIPASWRRPPADRALRRLQVREERGCKVFDDVGEETIGQGRHGGGQGRVTDVDVTFGGEMTLGDGGGGCLPSES